MTDTYGPVKVKKKPVGVEAIRYDGTAECERAIQMWMFGQAMQPGNPFRIATLEGSMTVSPGDWVIKGVAGEFYPCKPDIFEQTYEVEND
jgi:hypothetical protein